MEKIIEGRALKIQIPANFHDKNKYATWSYPNGHINKNGSVENFWFGSPQLYTWLISSDKAERRYITFNVVIELIITHLLSKKIDIS